MKAPRRDVAKGRQAVRKALIWCRDVPGGTFADVRNARPYRVPVASCFLPARGGYVFAQSDGGVAI